MFDQADQKSNRILVIDDNLDIHEDFKTVLREPATNSTLDALENDLFGQDDSLPNNVEPEYELDFASQGEEGLALVNSSLEEGRPFAMAFVDMRMPPGWDGLETIEKLWLADPKIQVVICTAFSDYSQLDIVKRLGRTDSLLILKKPFDPEEVVQMASAMVTKREMTRLAHMTLLQMENLVAERTEAMARAQFHDGETRLKMKKMQEKFNKES